MQWNENLVALNQLLASLYPEKQDTYRLLDEAGIPRSHVAFRDRAIDNLHSILEQAVNRGRLEDLISIARKDHGDLPGLVEAGNHSLRLDKGPVLDEDISWRSNVTTDTIEKIMGRQSTLLPVSFLERGVERSRQVALVRYDDGSSGSGFLVNKNIFVTNHHVVPDSRTARMATVIFNYQQSVDGQSLRPTELQLNPEDGFVTSSSPDDDWTLVRMQGNPNDSWGAVPLRSIDLSDLEYVNIIHHPYGGGKQISCYHNVVVYKDEYRVQYLTDTDRGSSGSPVFDSHWNLVALHHSGGWIRQPGLRNVVYRNEGININRVAAVFEERF
jgi:V8-like Glu-specific endopeptidase